MSSERERLMDTVVVVGAGLAGLRACEGLRQKGYSGRLVLVGDEVHDPYDRPPLSKQFLAGTVALEQVMLRSAEELGGLGLELRMGPEHRARRLDVAAGVVELEDGEELAFDGLVLATGSRARHLPGTEHLPGVFTLRSLDDAVSLKAVLESGARLLVVGAGFIGMEVAATARALGAAVTVVEPLEVPLGRVIGPLAGEALTRLHEAHGVRLLLGRGVASLEATPGGLRAELDDGTTLEADAVLVGIGAVPNVEWLDGSGLEIEESGVICDSTLEAAPGVVVAGDIARWPYVKSERVRLEHRTNAAEQGEHAAASLLGSREPFSTVPYVWSDQYDVKIQLLGIPRPTDDCEVLEGSFEEGSCLAVYGRQGSFTAAIGFHKARSLMRLRPLFLRGATFDEARTALG